MKIEKKSESFYILGYLLLELIFKNLAMWIYFFFEIWQIWVIFSKKNPLCISRNLKKFRSKFGEKFSQKKHIVLLSC
jgi:hypothetical protein